MSPRPKYESIAHDLRQQIRDGTLAPDDRVPTERELMDNYSVSITVARSAIAQLRTEGLVYSQQGKGTFVRKPQPLIRWATNRYSRRTAEAPHRREAKAAGVTDDFRAELSQAAAPSRIAQRLRIDEGAPVSQAVYRRSINGDPMQVSTQWEPLEITQGTQAERPSDGSLGSLDVIARFDLIGMHVTHVTETISSRMPTPTEANELELHPGIPVFAIERTHWVGETPVETAEITVRADRYVIENTQEVPL